MSTLSCQILVSNAILQGKKPGLQEGTAESGKENPQDDDAGTFTSSHLPQTLLQALVTVSGLFFLSYSLLFAGHSYNLSPQGRGIVSQDQPSLLPANAWCLASLLGSRWGFHIPVA